ncbi:MAG TPA: type IV secretion system protein VirB10 [Steroidobacteraceae bacterium]|jgi:type IV secretion system protein VirB10
MTEPKTDEEAVRGERAPGALAGAVSVQSRISNLLAIGLMSVLGLGMLGWYYAHALSHQGDMTKNAQTSSAKRAQGEASLPSLGHIASPPMAAPAEPASSPLNAMQATELAEIPLAPSTTPAAPVPGKTPEQVVVERQLNGAVFSSSATIAPAAAPLAAADSPEPAGLASLLRPTITTAVQAEMLPTQRLLLPKGAFIDCTLETAIDSTLPGMTTCVMASDAFGVDGQVVLLERGTKLVGETRGQVQQGSARVFVVWDEARTPAGVVVPLASPGTDEIGRSGLSGSVDRHFWERFGAALLVSVVDGGIQAAVQSNRGGGAVIVNPSASQDVMTEVLKSTVNIPPTVVKRQGERIQVLVARDLDFRSVYQLEPR